jgi:flagellin-like hook-associated protein FlgL
MAVSIGNVSRVSQSLRTYATLSRLQQNALSVFRYEQQIASGQNLLSVSDDPVMAEKISRLSQSLDSQGQILANLQHADDNLAAADSAISDISTILIDAARIASEQAGSLQSTDERASQATIIDGLIDQLMNIGNRQFRGLYLFGGLDVKDAPLTTELGRITAVGDLGERTTLVDADYTESFSTTVAEIYNLREEVTGGYANFDVQLATSVRLSELNGAVDAGIRLGRISVTEGATTFEVDFTGAETVADLIAKFDDAAAGAGSTLTLGISLADGAALQVVNGGAAAIQVDDVGQGTIAADLGIKKSAGAGLNIDGDKVNRRAMLATKLSDLGAGGVALPNGVVVTNGQLSATVTFTGATTVQDVLNRLNGSGVGIRASINEDGDGIEIENLMAGTPLVIGENGGTDAETLGIRTLDSSVSVSRLNGLRGIHPVTGNDIRITDSFGNTFEVDLSNASTIGDVIAAIDAAAVAAGSGLRASTSLGGAGLRIDETGPSGAGNITVESVNLSAVADELGISGTGTATELEGSNVGQFYQTGVLSALYRLRDGLLSDDSSEITEAGGQINDLQDQIAGTLGQVGARAQSIRDRMTQTEEAVEATQILLSGLKDVNFTEAVTKFQEAQTALQASLLTGSQTLNLSLLDFLQ